MKNIIVMICACMLALPVAGLCQGPEDRVELSPWWDRPVARNLGLSEAQVNQVRSIVRESRDTLIQLRANVRLAEGALADAMSEDKVNTNQAEAAIEKVVAARSDLTRAVSQMSLKLRQVLTYSQWQELRKRGAQRLLGPGPKRQRAGAGPKAL
jgi:Spy/CpxP family protein refolding chaperone